MGYADARRKELNISNTSATSYAQKRRQELQKVSSESLSPEEISALQKRDEARRADIEAKASNEKNAAIIEKFKEHPFGRQPTQETPVQVKTDPFFEQLMNAPKKTAPEQAISNAQKKAANLTVQGLDLLGRPANAVVNVLKESGDFKMPETVDVDGKVYPVKEAGLPKAPDIVGAAKRGITGEDRPSPYEIVMSPSQLERMRQKYPVMTGINEFLLGAITDPTTYIGGEVLGTVAKKLLGKVPLEVAQKFANGTVKVGDIANAAGKTEEEVQRLLDNEAADTVLKNAKPTEEWLQRRGPVVQNEPQSPIQSAETVNPVEPKLEEQTNNITALKNLRMTLKEGTPEHAAVSDAISRAEAETKTVQAIRETTPVTAQPIRKNISSAAETRPVASQGTTMTDRTIGNVGNAKVKVYQFENPEIKPYFQDYADYILDVEFVPNKKLNRDTDVMTKLKSDTGLQPAQIKDALKRLVKNKGQENYAAAKRVEIVIDDMLTNGFETIRGERIPPIHNYIDLKSKIEGREIVPSKGITADDVPVTKSNYAVPHSDKLPETDIDNVKNQLPDNEQELKDSIENIKQQLSAEPDPEKKSRLNLQLMAANDKLTEISKLKTNTLEKSPALQDEDIKKAIADIDMEYGVKTHEETIRRGKDMADAATDTTIENLRKNGLKSAEDTAAAYFITKKLADEAKQTGDYARLKSFLKGVQNSATSHGQTIEAFKIWQTDPDGMYKNATKVVEDAENALRKTDPEKINKINKETKDAMDAVDRVDKDTADHIKDEVNEKAREIIRNRKRPAEKDSAGGESPSKQGERGGNKPSENKEVKPEEMLADKIKNHVKDPETPKDDPVTNMVNELFRVAKESPITREKVKGKTALEFVSDAIKNRQEYADVWIKAKSIVRNKLQDNPEGLAKLEKYFDKGLRPPFSTANFKKAISEGMADLEIDIGEMVRNYYAVGAEQRKNLAEYLVEKSGLESQDAEALAKYVQNRMKELTKAKKEQILKGIFKDEKAAKPKPGALKSVEELSNAGAFVNNNYKDRVMEKLSPRLQRVINEKFKGTPTKASGNVGISDRIDFGELVRKSTSEIDFTRTKFMKDISEKLQVNDKDALEILRAVEQRFNEIVDEKRANILGNMFKKREATIKKTGIQRVQEYIDKQMELENLGAQEDSIRDFIKEKYGLPTLTNDDMAFITEHIDKLKTLQEGTRPYNETLWRIYNRIESKVPSSFIDKFRAWQRISMLPNARTFLRNILGNVFMEKMENFNELTTEALVDTIASWATGKRTVLGPSAAVQKSIAQAKGKLQGLSDTITDIAHGVDTYEVAGQYEISHGKNAFKIGDEGFIQSKINPVLNALEQFTNKTLQFGDRPFYEAALARRLKELQIIKKTKEVTDEMRAEAILYALDRTFQNDSKLAKGVLKMKKAIDDPAYETIANIVIPFAKTPANILDKISDYTPIGLVKAIGHLGKTAGKGTFNQLYFSQRLGRMLTGSGLIALGYVLANKGIITGKAVSTTNGNKKGNFDKETGKLGYALKVPDGKGGYTYIAYDWAQPVGSLMALGADAYVQGMNKGDLLKGIEGSGNTFFNMSMLQSLNSMMSYGNPMGGFITTMLGSTRQFTPTLLQQSAKMFDKYERDTSGEGHLEETANKFKSGIPGLRNTLPIKTDTFGKPVEVQEGYGPLQRAINIAVNPANTTNDTMNDYEKEMDRLYSLSTDPKKKADVLPSVLKDTIKDGKGNEYKLTLGQFNQYKKLYGDIAVKGLKDNNGRTVWVGLRDVIRASEYKKAPDDVKARRISTILSRAEANAKIKMLKELAPAQGKK